MARCGYKIDKYLSIDGCATTVVVATADALD